MSVFWRAVYCVCDRAGRLVANIRIKRSRIVLRKVCGEKDNAAFFAERFE